MQINSTYFREMMRGLNKITHLKALSTVEAYIVPNNVSFNNNNNHIVAFILQVKNTESGNVK